MKIIKKYIGEAVLLIGVFLFFSNAVNFDSSHSLCKYHLKNLSLSYCENPVVYYYDDNVLHVLGYGAVLITIGILVIKRKDKK
jgi:hypothetical protein